jgi:hypothetical protein
LTANSDQFFTLACGSLVSQAEEAPERAAQAAREADELAAREAEERAAQEMFRREQLAEAAEEEARLLALQVKREEAFDHRLCPF